MRLILLVVLALPPAALFAAETPDPVPAAPAAGNDPGSAPSGGATPSSVTPHIAEASGHRPFHRARPAALEPLYAGLVTLQAFDVAFTLHALDSGAREANPAMKGLAGEPLAFVAVKTGVTTGTILLAEHLWKRHNRKGAVTLLVASNLIMGVVLAKNARAW